MASRQKKETRRRGQVSSQELERTGVYACSEPSSLTQNWRVVRFPEMRWGCSACVQNEFMSRF